MRTNYVFCDLCGIEIRGNMAVLFFNDNVLTPDFKNIAVKKEADFCEECAEKVKLAVDKIGEEIKVAQSEKTIQA